MAFAGVGDVVMKKKIIGFSSFLFLLLLLVGGLSQPVSAQSQTQGQIPPLSEACGGEGRYLLGVIPSWDRGLGSCEDVSVEELLEGNKVKIFINNALTIIIMLAGIVAVAFVIVGGFTYIISSGNAEQATSARKTIINALIGLVIVLMGRVVTEIIYNQLTTL